MILKIKCIVYIQACHPCLTDLNPRPNLYPYLSIIIKYSPPTF